MAVPPGAYPASPIPIRALVDKTALKLGIKAQAAVAKLRKIAISPTVFLRLQRSTRMDIGNVNTTIAQATDDKSKAASVSEIPQSFCMKGSNEDTTILSA